MSSIRAASIFLSAAALRASAQGVDLRNGDPLTVDHPFNHKVKAALFESEGHNVQWVLALDYGNCNHACGELTCAEDMFEKVNSQHTFAAVLETIENAPGCSSYKVDTEYSMAPFIWEDEEAQCWVSGDASESTCGQEPAQFTDIRLCPCRKKAGKKAADEHTDELESLPLDEQAALKLGSKDAIESLHEKRSSAVLSWLPSAGSTASAVAAFCAVVAASASAMVGVAAWRASRQDESARLLAIPKEDEESRHVAQSHE